MKTTKLPPLKVGPLTLRFCEIAASLFWLVGWMDGCLEWMDGFFEWMDG